MAFWIPMAIMAGQGALQGAANQRRMEDHDAFRRATIKYSPWTNMRDPGTIQLPGVLQSAVTGAAQGAMFGKLGQDAGWWGGETPTKPSAPVAPKPSVPSMSGASQQSAALSPMMQAPMYLQSNDIYNQMQGSAGALGQAPGMWSQMAGPQNYAMNLMPGGF